MAIKGNLQDLNLATLIQVACTEQIQVHLTVRHNNQEAHLYFADGNIAHIALGSRVGEEVLYDLLSWENGTFELEKGIPPPAHTVTSKWSALLMEGMQRLDEKHRPEQEEPEPVMEEDYLADLEVTTSGLEGQFTQERKEEENEMAIRQRRSELLAEALNNLVANSTDIEGGALVGIDGLVISANIPISGLDEMAVGAAAAAVSGLSKRSIGQMKRGDFEQALLRGSKGYIIVIPVDERSVFVGLTSPDVNLGMVFIEARSVTQELASIMAE